MGGRTVLIAEPPKTTVRPELVEGPFFLSAPQEEERCFHRLGTNGVRKGYAASAALTAATAASAAPPSGPPPCAMSGRSEEHTSELQSLMRISYAVFCLKQKTLNTKCTQKT